MTRPSGASPSRSGSIAPWGAAATSPSPGRSTTTAGGVGAVASVRTSARISYVRARSSRARTPVVTDAADGDWKYVPVRRTALFVEESIYDCTQWAVFEPNAEPF